MKIRLGTLRKIIREAGGWASPPQPAGRNFFSSDITNREQIDRLDVVDNDHQQITSHLEDPTEDPEDCFGPVPPISDQIDIHQDPFSRDYGPIPHPNVGR